MGNLISPKETIDTRTTPLWLRNTLIGILILASACGYLFAGLAFTKGSSAFNHFAAEEFADLKTFSSESNVWTKVLKQAGQTFADDGPPLICNGVFIEENGRVYALLDNRLVVTGATVRGAIVTSITASNVVLRFREKTISLQPGETLSDFDTMAE